MDYTKRHEDAMHQWSIREQNEEIFEEDILEYLRDETAFADFGTGLRRIIRKKMPQDYPLDESTFLKEMAQKQKISFNRNTLKNWFDGIAPKKGDKDRERMFQICFALGLNVDETTELFQKVYCDWTFNFRNYREFIFYCCLNNGWTYERALEFIGKVEFTEQETDATVYTRLLHNTAKELQEDDAILNYIKRNKHNFDISNRTARQLLDALLSEVQGKRGEEKALKEGKINEESSYVAQDCVHNVRMWMQFKSNNRYVEEEDDEPEDRECMTKKSFFSVATMENIIYGIDLGDAQMQSGESVVKNSNLPQAVKGRFPRKETFTKKQPTSEEYRKMIILLYSYKCWVSKTYGGLELSFEEYRDGLDDVLYEAHLQKLYIGNPYDWIFLYCTLSNEPLSVFRAIIGEGILGD